MRKNNKNWKKLKIEKLTEKKQERSKEMSRVDSNRV